MINQLIQVVAPIFAVIGVGYIWSLKGQKYDLEFVTSIAINLGCPCLAFSTLTGLEKASEFARKQKITRIIHKVFFVCLAAILVFLLSRFDNEILIKTLHPSQKKLLIRKTTSF